MQTVDVAVAGAGIIGISVALELRRAGLSVAVYDKGEPSREATHAAGGMLAVNDPDNPPALLPLSQLSMALYPEYLSQIEEHGGGRVAYRTRKTLQAYEVPIGDEGVPPIADGRLQLHQPGLRWRLLNEYSLAPRDLAAALLQACRNAGVQIHSHTEFDGDAAKHKVLCTGAWTDNVFPRKGQMLAVQLPAGALDTVVRTHEIYLIPRGEGRTVIGATVENVGFDKAVVPEAIAVLKEKAAEYVPAVSESPTVEAWAGLRPATADGLPILGLLSANTFLATGHYRNGILLAPATARLIRQLILSETLSLDLTPYDVNRPELAIFAHRR